MLKRRGFIASLATGGAGLVAGSGLTVNLRADERAPDQVPGPPFQVAPPRNPVHRIGPVRPDGPGDVIGALMDDVFERLRQSVAGRSLVLVDQQRLGECEVRACGDSLVLRQQWNTGYQLSTDFLAEKPPPFDLDRFQRTTGSWTQGQTLCCGGGVPSALAFRAVSCVGIPIIPLGLNWAGYYIDEDSGIVMRALADYQFMFDHILLRFDVICG